MPTRVFSSLILREILKEIDEVGDGIEIDRVTSEDWAEAIAEMYSQEMEHQPIVYLTETENDQAHMHLVHYKDRGVDLAERATHHIRGFHAAQIRAYLEDNHRGWPLMALQEKVEAEYYPFPSDDKAPSCFKEWFAVATVWRLTLAMPQITFQDAMIGTANSLLSPIPRLWEEKLEECMQVTDASAVLPAPRSGYLSLKRCDLDSVLPWSYIEADESGLLTNNIITSWFQILLSHRNKTKPGCTVVIPPDSLDLGGATPGEICVKAMLVNKDLDMVLFPTVIKERNHCVMVVAYPKQFVLTVYDSLGHANTKRLQKHLPWIKEHYRPKEHEWEVIWIECQKQKDEVASGVFMLINALFAVWIRDTVNRYFPEDSMFLRRYVAAIICMGELPDPV